MNPSSVLRTLSGLGVATAAVGYGFKFMHWAGADVLLLSGLLLVLLPGTVALALALRSPVAPAGQRYLLAAALTLLTLGMLAARYQWLPARPLVLAGLAAPAGAGVVAWPRPGTAATA